MKYVEYFGMVNQISLLELFSGFCFNLIGIDSIWGADSAELHKPIWLWLLFFVLGALCKLVFKKMT